MGILLLICICLLLIPCLFVLQGKAAGTKAALKRHPWILKAVVSGYVVFAGCFVFPISSEPFPLDFTKAYLLIASYAIIALGFAGAFGEGKGIFVYLLALALTGLGLLCRYLLEYGEVSNTYNFTWENITMYLALAPLYTVALYRVIGKNLKAEGK